MEPDNAISLFHLFRTPPTRSRQWKICPDTHRLHPVPVLPLYALVYRECLSPDGDHDALRPDRTLPAYAHAGLGPQYHCGALGGNRPVDPGADLFRLVCRPPMSSCSRLCPAPMQTTTEIPIARLNGFPGCRDRDGTDILA